MTRQTSTRHTLIPGREELDEAWCGRRVLGRYDVLSCAQVTGERAEFLGITQDTGRAVVIWMPSVLEEAANLRVRRWHAHLMRLEHDSVIKMIDFGSQLGRDVIVFEGPRGELLSERIARLGRVGTRRAASILTQVLDPVAYVHMLGGSVGGLDPSSIWLRDIFSGVVARYADVTRLRFPGDVPPSKRWSSALYAAPEVIAGSEPDARSDVYSVGALLYHMLTGRPPFDASDEDAILTAHQKSSPAPIDRVFAKAVDGGSLPVGLVMLVHACLDKNPNVRPRDLSEVLEALLPFAPKTPEIAPAAAESASSTIQWAGQGWAETRAIERALTLTPIQGLEQVTRASDEHAAVETSSGASLDSTFDDRPSSGVLVPKPRGRHVSTASLPKLTPVTGSFRSLTEVKEVDLVFEEE